MIKNLLNNRLIFLLFICVVTAITTPAQNRTTGNRGTGGGGGNRGGGAPAAFTLAVTATTLTRTPEAGMGGAAPTPQVYQLDGASHDMPMGQATAKVTAKWDDSKSKINIEQTVDRGNGPTTSKIEYAVEGDWLVITTTAPPRGGGDAVPTKVYYKKAM